jgi:hypothetical protein
MTFRDLFRTDDLARDNFLARLFGIFNEEIVRCWAKAPQAPYEDLGRPTIRPAGEKKPYYTLDFTFRSRHDRRVYVAEMKCWLAYENYRHMILESSAQLDYHTNPAFQIFLDVARHPRQYDVRVGGRPQAADGSILVWGSCTDEGRKSVKDHYILADVLSVETIIRDLLSWQSQDYLELVGKYERWCGELFAGLRNRKAKHD